MDKMPSVDYLTWLDWFIQMCFCVVFAVTVHCIALMYRAVIELEPIENDGDWQGPDAWQGSQRHALIWIASVWLVLNIALPLLVLAARRVQKSTEALHWWDVRSNVLWLGPLDATAADNLTIRTMQAALDSAAEERRQRPITPPMPRAPGGEDDEEDEEDKDRVPYGVRVENMRVVRPAELEEEARHMPPGTLPRTRQPFILLELRSQTQAYDALKRMERPSTVRPRAPRALGATAHAST